MDNAQIIALLVAAIGGLFAYSVWLVKVIVKIANRNTEAMTQLASTIDNLPDAIMNKILMSPPSKGKR